MHVFDLVLMLAALVCFLCAAANLPTRINLVGLGLALWVLVPLLHALQTTP